MKAFRSEYLTSKTQPAPAFPEFCGDYSEVVPGEWVPAKAMRLTPMPYSGVTTPDVLLMRHDLNMLWVHAGRDAAQMVKVHLFRNWTVFHLVREPMRQLHYASVEKLAVSRWSYVFQPQPARCPTISLRVRHRVLFPKSDNGSCLPLLESH